MKADEADTRAGSDAFGVLGWGLRRYWWLILLGVLALGVLAPALMLGGTDRYDAQAQVGPTDRLNLPNTDLLPKIGQSLFENGAVATAVRQSFVPALRRSTSVIPERVELVEGQDNLIFTVVGHGDTPESARASANVAASTLTEELNKYTRSVGSFAVQQLAEEPAKPVPTMGRPTAIGLGMLVGLIAGIAAVIALLAWRRPVVDAGGPILARLQLGRSQQDILGLPQLCHRLLSSHTELLLLTGPKATARERHHLARELARVLGRRRSVRLVRGGDLDRLDPLLTPTASAHKSGGVDSTDRTELVIVDDPTQIEVATRPDDSLTLLVVKEGIGQAALGRLTEQYLDPGNNGVVLVRRSRRGARSWRRSGGR